jgi:hypothetical protein
MKENRSILKKLWIVVFLLPSITLFSQEADNSNFSAGADFFSSYVWRGTKYGTGPHIQPLVKFNSGIFTAGGWGSFDFSGYQEADLFFSFALPAGFCIGMTDYYYPAHDYFDYSKATGSHAFEINGGFMKGGVALAGNIIVNEAGGAGSSGGDIYFQAGYTFKSFNILAGAGNGWHTSNGNFNVCNVGFGITRTIRVTESFGIPVVGQIIVNPERQKMYIVIGFTL